MVWTVQDRHNYTILQDTASINIDADQIWFQDLPTDFGDCLLLECQVMVFGIATILASVQTFGPLIYLDLPGLKVDPVGTAFWVTNQANGVSALVQPDTPVLWKQGEAIIIRFEEIDTNASPTADLEVYVRVQRLRYNP